MKTLRIVCALSLLALVCGLAGAGQRGCSTCGGSAQAAPVYVQPAAPDRWEWKAFTDDPDVLALEKNGKQVGGYRFEEGVYLPYDGRTWGAKTKTLPIPLPTWAKARSGCDCKEPCPFDCDGKRGGKCTCATGAIPNYGLDAAKIHDGAPNSLDGKTVTRKQLIEAIDAGSGAVEVPNDADALCVTYIDKDVAARKRVVDDFEHAPALAAWKGKVRLQEYDPDEWAVKCGFATDGPRVYCSFPNGQVPVNMQGYPGPEEMSRALFTAQRRRDPLYDPKNDPDLPPFLKPAPPPPPPPAPVPVKPLPAAPEPAAPVVVEEDTTGEDMAMLGIGGLVVGGIVFARRQKKK